MRRAGPRVEQSLEQRADADEVAAGELGAGFTRNAVIGKVNRLKQAGAFDDLPVADVPEEPRAEAVPSAQVERLPRRSTLLPKVADIRMRPTLSAEAVAPEPVVPAPQARFEVNLPETDWLGPYAVHSLDAQTCRWPVGDPLRSDFRFCGCRASASGPYCAPHAALAFSRSDRRSSAASRSR